MQFNSLNDLFVDQLRDLYNAEKQLVRALPKMAKAASDESLKEGFENHLEETEGQVERLEQIFESLGKRAGGKTCQAMKGLIEEGTEAIEANGSDEVIDAALIAAAQRVEHYEIAAYGTARAFAEILHMDEAVQLLEQTLEEEKWADQKLSEIAEGGVNQAAAAAGGSEEEEEEEEGGSKRRGQGHHRHAHA